MLRLARLARLQRTVGGASGGGGPDYDHADEEKDEYERVNRSCNAHTCACRFDLQPPKVPADVHDGSQQLFTEVSHSQIQNLTPTMQYLVDTAVSLISLSLALSLSLSLSPSLSTFFCGWGQAYQNQVLAELVKRAKRKRPAGAKSASPWTDDAVHCKVGIRHAHMCSSRIQRKCCGLS